MSNLATTLNRPYICGLDMGMGHCKLLDILYEKGLVCRYLWLVWYRSRKTMIDTCRVHVAGNDIPGTLAGCPLKRSIHSDCTIWRPALCMLSTSTH